VSASDELISPTDLVFMIMAGNAPPDPRVFMQPARQGQGPSSLSGRVFVDGDGDGRFSDGDAGLAGVEVVLTGRTATGQPVRAATRTRGDGQFLFDGLPPGSYAVSGPPGLTRAGTVNGQPVGEACDGGVARIALPPGAVAESYSFAEIRPAALSGLVLLDDDGAEEPFAGVTVLLSGVDGRGRVVQLAAEADARGCYRFVGLHPGAYDVFAAAGKGYATVSSRPGDRGGRRDGPGKLAGVVLASGAHASGYNFTLAPTGLLMGRASPGTRVTLTGPDGARDAVACPAGVYRFDRLRPGVYGVEAGGAALEGISLAPGAASAGNDFATAGA